MVYYVLDYITTASCYQEQINGVLFNAPKLLSYT